MRMILEGHEVVQASPDKVINRLARVWSFGGAGLVMPCSYLRRNSLVGFGIPPVWWVSNAGYGSSAVEMLCGLGFQGGRINTICCLMAI